MIRKMRSEDKKTYMEMAREFYHSDAVLHPVPDTYFERTADEALRSDVYAEIFLFECENEAAGYGLIAKTYSQEAGGMVWWIEEVYVREAFRSKGIGRKFFAYLDKVKGSAVTRMRLEVEEDNTRAVALYKKLGYKPLEYAQMIKDAPLK
ncbi:GNAT family N-acetyltransferase [[Ruminococcus] torques]|uniref:GNAT family N-acetyltransferase n=1 Tax=[Ruminococcus] torques TaxID=33039 RepID=UPI0022E24157|nr:GNAT family N-acetyltransferase [[Ruminococcus] torques]